MRNYIVASWNDADQYDYSGEQIGNRQSKSQKVHFNPDGSACVASYSDPEPVKKVIPVAERILPQRKRVQTLTTQMQELVAEYKDGKMSIEEYSMLLAVVSKKRERAVELLNKAVSVKAPFEDVEDDTQPVKIDAKQSQPVKQSPITDSIKQKACQVWTEARIFLVGSVAACVGLMWLAN